MEDLGGLAVRATATESPSRAARQIPRQTTRPIAIDLFAGVGGLSLGFEQAGFDVVGAVEIDPVHAAVHHYNFPNCTVIPKSVALLTGDEIRSLTRIGPADIDVVFGGAPCQGFSLIGQRALDDPRNSLVREFVRLVGELQPKFVVFENVKGLTVGRHKAFLSELIEALGSVGYTIRTPWKVLDSAYFGVPQHRERLILLAARKGIPLPDYPAPQCRPADGPSAEGLSAGPTCYDALSDLPDVEDFPQLWVVDEVRIRPWSPKGSYAKEMRCTAKSAWHYGYVRRWDPARLTSSMLTEHTPISRRRFRATKGGKVEPISRFYKLPARGLSNTLRAGTDSARGAFTSPRPIHYAKPRCVTVREMARLHGFPDWFRFHATKWHGARQIGNAVAPPLARAIASKLLETLSIKPRRPKRTISLLSPELLTMSVSAAAEFFGVPNPIAKRNMRSGAKKRKQADIEAEARGVSK